MTSSQSHGVLLEVPVASVEDALAAQEGGADRLELNAALSLGRLTPSLETLIEVKAAIALPVLVMIRPRPGGFAYSEADFKVMQRDVDLALQHGAGGIVFGILTADGKVDAAIASPDSAHILDASHRYAGLLWFVECTGFYLVQNPELRDLRCVGDSARPRSLRLRGLPHSVEDLIPAKDVLHFLPVIG